MLREVQDAPTGQEKIDRGYEFDKDEINPMDRFFMRPWNSGLSRTSDVMLTLTTAGTGAALLTLPGLENGERITLGVMFTELLLWSLNVQFFLKYTMPRYRPYNYYSGTLPDLADKPDSRESFPSGHAMNAVSAAVFFHTIYSELRPAGPAWPVWTAYIAAAGYRRSESCLRAALRQRCPDRLCHRGLFRLSDPSAEQNDPQFIQPEQPPFDPPVFRDHPRYGVSSPLLILKINN